MKKHRQKVLIVMFMQQALQEYQIVIGQISGDQLQGLVQLIPGQGVFIELKFGLTA